MPTPEIWTFTQLAGPKTQLSLGGWSAPFGRPRQGELLDAGITVRNARTDYAGTNLVPTIHTFGTSGKPFTIHGRWMDQTIPAMNGAQLLARKWKDFVGAQAPVRAAWGQILSYQIFIHDLGLKFESRAEVVWSMTAHVLLDEQAPVFAVPVALPTPIDVASQMQDMLGDVYPFDDSDDDDDEEDDSYGPLFGMLPGAFSGVSSAFGLFGGAFSTLSSTCSTNFDFATADDADLGSMQASLQTMQVGLLQLRASTDYLAAQVEALNEPSAGASASLEGSLLTSDLVTQFVTDKAASDAAIANFLSLIASMRLAILQIARGQAQSAYVGVDGDTWESVGERLLGGADGGRAIRQMNGVRYGEQPVAGRKYTIPKGA